MIQLVRRHGQKLGLEFIIMTGDSREEHRMQEHLREITNVI